MSGPSSNRYPAKCEHCKKNVEPHAGLRIACDEIGLPHKGRKSKWIVVHETCWDEFTSKYKYRPSKKSETAHQEKMICGEICCAPESVYLKCPYRKWDPSRYSEDKTPDAALAFTDEMERQRMKLQGDDE